MLTLPHEYHFVLSLNGTKKIHTTNFNWPLLCFWLNLIYVSIITQHFTFNMGWGVNRMFVSACLLFISAMYFKLEYIHAYVYIQTHSESVQPLPPRVNVACCCACGCGAQTNNQQHIKIAEQRHELCLVCVCGSLFVCVYFHLLRLQYSNIAERRSTPTVSVQKVSEWLQSEWDADAWIILSRFGTCCVWGWMN